jgi:hypothetical protein
MSRSIGRPCPSSTIVQARAAASPTSQLRHVLDRLLRARQADALQRPPGDAPQPLERQRQCAPRRLPITAWISSTITVRTVASICRLRPT